MKNFYKISDRKKHAKLSKQTQQLKQTKQIHNIPTIHPQKYLSNVIKQPNAVEKMLVKDGIFCLFATINVKQLKTTEIFRSLATETIFIAMFFAVIVEEVSVRKSLVYDRFSIINFLLFKYFSFSISLNCNKI